MKGLKNWKRIECKQKKHKKQQKAQLEANRKHIIENPSDIELNNSEINLLAKGLKVYSLSCNEWNAN